MSDMIQIDAEKWKALKAAVDGLNERYCSDRSVMEALAAAIAAVKSVAVVRREALKDALEVGDRLANASDNVARSQHWKKATAPLREGMK